MWSGMVRMGSARFCRRASSRASISDWNSWCSISTSTLSMLLLPSRSISIWKHGSCVACNHHPLNYHCTAHQHSHCEQHRTGTAAKNSP